MAFVTDFLEGFDCYGTDETGDGVERWPVWPINFSLSTGWRRGNYGRGILIPHNTSGAANTWMHMPFSQTYRCVIVGFAINFRGIVPAYQQNNFPISLHASSDADHYNGQVNLTMNTSGKLELRLNTYTGTVLDTTTTVFQPQRWYYLELKIYIDNTAGAYELKIDGTTEFSDTSVDTQYRTNENYVGALVWRGGITTNFGPTHNAWIDDMYVRGDQSNTAGGFLGDIRIYPTFPDADGNYSQWTRSTGITDYVLIDDPTLDADDYLYTATTGNKFTVGHESFSQPGTIVGVDQIDRVWSTGGNQRTIKPFCRSNSTDYAQTAIRTLQGRYMHHVYEVDPDTSSAWDSADLNSAEFGLEIV